LEEYWKKEGNEGICNFFDLLKDKEKLDNDLDNYFNNQTEGISIY